MTNRNIARTFVQTAALVVIAEIVIAVSMILAGIYFHAVANASHVIPRDVATSQLPACEYEDGNPDGLPCLWTNDEGRSYYNDGSNYRDSNNR